MSGWDGLVENGWVREGDENGWVREGDENRWVRDDEYNNNNNKNSTFPALHPTSRISLSLNHDGSRSWRRESTSVEGFL